MSAKSAASVRNDTGRSSKQLRVELGYADYLGALQRYRTEYPRDPHLLTVSHFLINYPFADRLYPNALEVIEHVKPWGLSSSCPTEMWSFSRERSNDPDYLKPLAGNVLIYIHKDQELDDVRAALPCWALRLDRRQTAYSLGRESHLGLARHDRVSLARATMPWTGRCWLVFHRRT